jgi:hypothetical protein
MEKELVEHNELIAERTPPGDKWELVIDRGTIVEGLVMALTTYMRKTKFKGDYRLEPLKGKLYAIRTEEVEIEEPVQMVYDLYGEGM